ncbi:hypothetical protein B0T09DRAFT_324353 [Sordaria sp. MPI-SDFR-AT-0083]|nr:hypothetical protein B0T09DRAFT_324353 [Sordaria sp. MPI-SDFR-AT-0083]
MFWIRDSTLPFGTDTNISVSSASQPSTDPGYPQNFVESHRAFTLGAHFRHRVANPRLTALVSVRRRVLPYLQSGSLQLPKARQSFTHLPLSFYAKDKSLVMGLSMAHRQAPGQYKEDPGHDSVRVPLTAGQGFWELQGVTCFTTSQGVGKYATRAHHALPVWPDGGDLDECGGGTRASESPQEVLSRWWKQYAKHIGPSWTAVGKLQNSANVLGQLAIILLILVGCPPICTLPTSNACDFAPCAFAGCSQRIRCLLSGT